MKIGWILNPPLQSSRNDPGCEGQAGREAARRKQSGKWKRPGIRDEDIIKGGSRTTLLINLTIFNFQSKKLRSWVNLGKSDGVEATKRGNISNCLVIELGPGFNDHV